ncbi:isochorismatase family protein [Actinospica durhamensis]|uniref:Isochorismatase family protein n=1 Tax=Actinospica durhamensis TaxID=1508375 RepID=A0A941EWB9_9ACTN|nr:isochorismatase family protein [Actinospica durhamensis]MBR7837618.1 isochorismatase family protein [Actinospica durhamensis]
MPALPKTDTYRLPVAGDLPENIAPWTVEPDRAVLLVHDMQHYFLRAFPPALRAELVANAEALRGRCADHGVQVAFTAQPGDMTEPDRGLLRDFWGPGMKAEPGDREIIAQLAPRPGDWVLPKWRYSAFYRTDLLERMRAHKRDQLIVCGVYAHVGVLATALEAFTHDFEVFLVGDAVADFTEAEHRHTLEHAAATCAVVLTEKEVLT